MSPVAMSDAFYGAVIDTMDLPRQEAADTLGASVGQIINARRRLREGKPFLGAAPWTEDENFIIQSSPLLTAKQLAEILPGRSREAVKRQRSSLGALKGLPKHAFRADPFAPAGRPLIAKTCSKCGIIRPGKAFRWRSASKTWMSECVYCSSSDSRDLRARNAYSSMAGNARRQAVSLPGADQNGSVWTGAEMKILADATLTTLQKALRLHRTYYSTTTAVQRFGFASAAPSLGDPERDVWIIDNPSQLAVLA